MMIEQVISFETAKLAREKGFDLETTHFYSSTRGHIEGLKEVKHSLGKKQGFTEDAGVYATRRVNWNDEDFDDIEYWSAPTQSLLQMWLREIHQIHILVEVLRDMDHCDSYYWRLRKPASMKPLYDKGNKGLDIMDTSPVGGAFDSFEEALEKALFEALKLIKSVTE